MKKKSQTILIILVIILIIGVGSLIAYLVLKPPPIKKCGDKICGDLENWQNCAADCEKPFKPVCGNNVCEENEDGVCLQDCPLEQKCGDGICDAKEITDSKLCSLDCDFECNNGDVQDYECDNGEEVKWCKCINSKWSCSESPEDLCETGNGGLVVNGEIYFVSKQGSDNNDGSEQNPWLTIQKAADSVSPGNIVYVKEGVYKESVNIIKSGTQEKRIIFSNFENDNVEVMAESCHGFYVEADYITIRGFKITDAYFEKNADCPDWTASGITTHRNNNIFENNEISNSMYGIMLRADIGEDYSGELQWPTEGSNIVRNNYIHNTDYAAVRVKRSNNNTVRDNKFYYNHLKLGSFNTKDGNILLYTEASLVFYCLNGLRIENNEFYEPGFGAAILEVDMVTRTAQAPSMAPNPDETKCPLYMDNIIIKNNIAYKTENQEYSIVLDLGRDFALGSNNVIDNNVWFNGNPDSKIIEWGYNFWRDNNKDDGITPLIWTLAEFQKNTGYDMNSNDENPYG